MYFVSLSPKSITNFNKLLKKISLVNRRKITHFVKRLGKEKKKLLFSYFPTVLKDLLKEIEVNSFASIRQMYQNIYTFI